MHLDNSLNGDHGTILALRI